MIKSKEKSADLSGARVVDITMKTKGFPFGILLILAAVFSLLVTGAMTGYFLYTGKQRIGDIESYTRNYSITLAEAFSGAAELGYKKGSNEKLKSLFRDRVRRDTFDEAFFVLRNGALVAHSDADAEKELRGNIANDEFAYNTDLILRPVIARSRDIQFTDYNIISKRIPFTRTQRSLLKRYLYDGIDTSGWLASRAVFSGENPVGTVNLIIGKDRIFRFIAAHWGETLRVWVMAMACALLLSLALSSAVFLRYRGIQEDAMALAEEKIETVLRARGDASSASAEGRPAPPAEPAQAVTEQAASVAEGRIETTEVEESIPMELFEEPAPDRRAAGGEGRIIELASMKKTQGEAPEERPREVKRVFDASREILDAIPIDRKRSS
ncbi:MAG: hypothetical protein JXA20_14930 [Spirochaetes bacterium]|nr:hypothetical protein [Spirochaetota bacterium]